MTVDRDKGICRVIGVDCATQPQRLGLALGEIRNGHPRIIETAVWKKRSLTWDDVDRQVADWVDGATLIALDAPLGWPRALGQALDEHRAGAVLRSDADAMFRRTTDDVVHAQLSQRPLDVGADRIARTAHAASSFLKRLQERIEQQNTLDVDSRLGDPQRSH